MTSSHRGSYWRLAIVAGALLAPGCLPLPDPADGGLFDAGTPGPGEPDAQTGAPDAGSGPDASGPDAAVADADAATAPTDANTVDPSADAEAGLGHDAATDADAGTAPDAAIDAGSDATVDAAGPRPAEPTSGCGTTVAKTGTFDVKITSGGKSRTFTVTIPSGYNATVPHRVVVGFHGRDWNGAMMRGYLNLERYSDGKVIFVYPSALRNGSYIGWQLGPYATRFGGNEDLVFFDDMLAHLANEYCIDTSRVFVTGQSWGGDMTHLVACLRGDRVRAAVGVAANGTYYMPPKAGSCLGAPDIFTLHGVDDGDIPFAQGQALRDFWNREHACAAQTDPIEPDQCVEARGCTARTVWCPYGPRNGGHQIPNYYSQSTMRWFLQY